MFSNATEAGATGGDAGGPAGVRVAVDAPAGGHLRGAGDQPEPSHRL
jgi:hypothetical protein